MLSKLVPIVGDICETNLGLDEDLSDVIADEVDVIVNSAANTTFDERLALKLYQKFLMFFLLELLLHSLIILTSFYLADMILQST